MAVLTLSVCLFLPLGVQSQSKDLFDNLALDFTLVETLPSVSDESLDAAHRRMAHFFLLDWGDNIDDDISMMIGLRKACAATPQI